MDFIKNMITKQMQDAVMGQMGLVCIVTFLFVRQLKIRECFGGESRPDLVCRHEYQSISASPNFNVLITTACLKTEDGTCHS